MDLDDVMIAVLCLVDGALLQVTGVHWMSSCYPCRHTPWRENMSPQRIL